MYHLKSLRKIENLIGVKNYSLKISNEDKDIYDIPVIDDNFGIETEWINT